MAPAKAGVGDEATTDGVEGDWTGATSPGRASKDRTVEGPRQAAPPRAKSKTTAERFTTMASFERCG
ncbi:MAG TPA: hypothetical protein VF972_05120 [Actinomycetota bacterium]